MNIALSRAIHELIFGVYMDDVTIGNNSPASCWRDTREAMICVLRQGLPINIKKCKFLQNSIDVLGVNLEGDKYGLGKKALARLFATRLPRTLAELQSVAGKLNHCAPFVTDFKRKIKPIIDIMGGENFGKWREEQTQALNTIGAMI